MGPALAGPAGRRPVGGCPLARRVRGRGATPLEVAIFNLEYARSWAPQPVNRTGVNLVGPTLLTHGHDDQRTGLPAILSAGEIWCQLFSEPGAGSTWPAWPPGPPGSTAAGRRGPEGVDLLRPVRPVGHRPGPHRPGGAQPPGHHLHGGGHGAEGVEVRPLVTMTTEAEFNEVFLDGVFVPDDQVIGGLHPGWSVANTTLAHERGTTFPFKEQVVHEVYLDQVLDLAAHSAPSTTRWWPTSWSTPTCGSGSSGSTTGGP